MDFAVTQWIIQNMHHPVLDRVLTLITSLGDAGFIWIITCAILLLLKKTRRWGIIFAVALLLMYLFGEILLKNIFQRARPFTLLPEFQLLVPPPSSYSFPSVHSVTAFTSATVLCFMDKRIGVCAQILAALIAFSRVYLVLHYFSDVLVGALLGVGCAFLARWLCEKYWARRRS